MTKLSKLVANPQQFIEDFAKKRNLPLLDKMLSLTGIVKQQQLVETKNDDLILSNMRLFKKTVHLLHTGEGMLHGPSHLTQWIESFIQSEEQFAILIRNKALFNWAISNYSNIDIVYAKNPSDVEKILEKLPFLKAVYYFSNTGNLIHTLRYNQYKHIFLGHGDSDKAASAHKFFRVYDQIWVAGEAHIDRFRNSGFNIDHIEFVKIGRPTLERTLTQTLQQKKKFKKIKKLVYLPTWEGVYEENNYSSAYLSPIILSEINKVYNSKIIVKYHPVMGSRDESLTTIPRSLNELFLGKSHDLEIIDKLVPVTNFISAGDAFVCDISAVVSECISTLAPIFIYMPTDRNVTISNSNMDYSDYAYLFSSVDELMHKLDEVFVNGNDVLAEARYKALDYLLTIDATISNEFLNQLKLISKDATLVNNPRDKVVQ